MKPFAPNGSFPAKTIAKLPGLGIAGRFVTQNDGELGQNMLSGQAPEPPLDENAIRNIAREVFSSSTPSMVGGEGSGFELPEVPDKNRIYVLASVNGKIKWLETESCQQ